MSKRIDYFFSVISPYTYLGHERFEALARQEGLSVNYRPSNIGKVFSVSGGLPVNQRPAQRRAYRFMELKRWREHLGVALNLEPKFFPVPDQLAACAVIGAINKGEHPGKLIGGLLRAAWAEDRDISDEAAVRAIAEEQGYDGGVLLEAATQPGTVAQYEAFTQEAIDAGVFGAPTWVVDGELFWGQDRLEFVQRALGRT